MMRAIKGMSLLITGGGTGIGAGTAAYFVGHGARVTICGRRADRVQATAAALGPACHAVVADITLAADRERLVREAVAHGGGLDALVNTAADMLRGPISELREDELLKVFNTNVVAAMMLTGLAVPLSRS